MTSYEAIFHRQSIRKFKMERLSQEFFRNFRKFEHGLVPFDKNIRYAVEMYNVMDGEARVKGLFQVKAPYYLVIYSEKSEWSLVNAGFIMEQIVLYLTEKGVGTCYQGGARLTDVPIPDGMEAKMVLAFGPPEGKLYRDAERARRLPLKDLCVFKETSTEETRLMMQAARMAPSAINSQPWRFMVYQNRIHVFIRKNMLKAQDSPLTKLPIRFISDMADSISYEQFDIGVMLCHIILTAEECWRDIEFEQTDDMAAKEFKNNDYFLTVKLV